MNTVLVANVSSYCELRLRLKGYSVGFYFPDIMQFPILKSAFLNLFKRVTDMVLLADVSSYCVLSFARNGNIVLLFS